MKQQHIRAMGILALGIFGLSVVVAGQQDWFALTSPNGISFSEFRGYDAWQVIAPSQPANGIKTILGNASMMKAYSDGFPANGRAVPDGAMMAKAEWSTKDNPGLPGGPKVPATLKNVGFMVKDSKRFPDTDGWGYAQIDYDATSATFSPVGNNAAFATAACHQCHTRVKGRDFVFTDYAKR